MLKMQTRFLFFDLTPLLFCLSGRVKSLQAIFEGLTSPKDYRLRLKGI